MKKHLQYLWYVLRHKWFVLLAGWKMGGVFDSYEFMAGGDAYPIPWWRLIIHDFSKFTPTEWFPYVEKFYGDDRDSEETKRSFHEAWQYHYQRNDHHPEHWQPVFGYFYARPNKMSAPATVEMVADWMGAGRAITGKWDVIAWWEKERDKKVLHPQTSEDVEFILSILKGNL